MTDPVGLLGTVVGVVSLGLRVYGSLKEYLDAIKSRDRRVDQTLKGLELLQQSLKLINSAVPSLGDEHRKPADAVMSSLLEAQADLQALRDKLQENKPLDPTNLIEKVKEKKKKLAFPFRISDLDKLESTLDKIVKNLSIAMQGLGLNISSVIDTKVSNISPQLDTLTAISRDIQATQATGVARQIYAQSALNSGLHAIECSTSHIEDQVLRLAPNMESVLDEVLKIGQTIDLVLKNQSSLPDSETLHRIAASMMVAKPALLSTASDAVNSNSTALSGLATLNPQDDIPQDSALEVNRKSRTSLCNCRYLRRVTRKSSSWFLFSTFEELVTESRHRPCCPLFQSVNLVKHRRFGVVLAGLRRYLSIAVSVSLCMTHGAGGRSISPTIRYFGMVDREKSPAFRIVNGLAKTIIISKIYPKRWTELLQDRLPELVDTDILDPSLLHVSSFNDIIRVGISKLRQIYGSGAALPTDVDEHGRTAIHILFSDRNIAYIAYYHELTKLYDLFGALLGLDIPCTTPAELTTKSILDMCLGEHLFESSISNMRQTARFISEKIVVDLLLRETSGDMTTSNIDLVTFRNYIAASEVLAEALGLDSPIYMALLRRRKGKLRRLLQSIPISSLVEIDNRPTLAHLAIGWPTGLKILLDLAPRLEINSEYYGESPFMLAMRHSGSECKGRHVEICTSCICANSVKVLLEAKCHLTSGNILDLSDYYKCSLRSFFTMFEHIKTWRDKLKSLLFKHMPEMKLSRRYDSSVLDVKAGEVIEALERRGIFPFQKYDLQPDDYRLGSQGGPTIYHSIHDHRIAEKAFELGFRDVDADFNGLTPLMVAMKRFTRVTPYVNWLITHGATYTCLTPPTKVNIDILPKQTVSHVLLGKLAFEACIDSRTGNDTEVPSLDNLRLLSKASIENGCEGGCSYSSDGCYPITIFQRVFLREYMKSYSHYKGSWDRHSYYQKGVMWICEKLLNHIVKKDKFDITTKAILRGFTFEYLVHHSATLTELGLRHTCCINLYTYFLDRREEPTQDDLENYTSNHGKVRKNDDSLILKLEELVVEFTERFSRIAFSFSDFIQNYWFPCMKEVVDELERSYMSKDEMTEDDDEDSEVSDLDVVRNLPGAF